MLARSLGGALPFVREAVSAAIRWSGVSSVVRNTIARRKVSIVLYHDPSPRVLEQHLRYLARRYHFITLPGLVEAIYAKDWSRIPPKSLVITFDDGMARNASLLGLFKRYGVRPTIYICSQLTDTNRHYWFTEVDDDQPLKRLPNSERLRALEATAGFTPTREYADRQVLNRAEIAAMLDHVDFASHSRFHPILTTCSDRECSEEIERSRREVEALTGRACLHFAFPNGDYGAREIEILKRAGYRSARTIDLGWNDVDTDPFELRILSWRDDASVNRLAADLSGIAGYLSRLRRGSIGGRWRSSVMRDRDEAVAAR